MSERSGPVLLVGAACLAAGLALGWILRPAPPSATAPAATAPDTRSAREDELLAENATLRDRLAAARREAAAFAAAEAAPAPEGDAGAGAEADAAPKEDRTPEEIRAFALRDLESVEYELSADPTNPDLLARLVDAATEAGEIDRALARLERLAKEHPENADVQNQLGRAHLRKLRDVTDQMEQGQIAFAAVNEFSRALELDPDHFGARLNRGVTNYFMPTFLGKLDRSIEDLEHLVKQGGGRGDDDRYARAYAWLARSYRKAGRDEDAERTLAEGLKLFPADPDLLRARE